MRASNYYRWPKFFPGPDDQRRIPTHDACLRCFRAGDVVSKGRLIVGIVAGYRPEEFAAVGVSLAERCGRMAGGHFERALRRSRRVYAKRRAALLAAAGTYLAGRVDITGTDAGTHVLMWFRRIPVGGLPALVERAASAGVGVYPATRYFLRPPRRAGVLLGYVAIPDGDIEEGIRRLAAVLP